MSTFPYRLGKLPPRPGATQELEFARYAVGLPQPPTSLAWADYRRIPRLGMLLNNQLGDCVEAAALHQIQVWTANSRGLAGQFVPTDQQALIAYEQIAGYNPLDPSTDRGTYFSDLMRFWLSPGVAGHRIDAYTTLNSAHTTATELHVRQAMHLLGGMVIGLAMPVTAMSQTAPGSTWTVGTGPNARRGSWGGHGVVVTGYTPNYLTLISWGAYYYMSWQFYWTYRDESYAIVSRDWLTTSGVSPSGFALSQLLADLRPLAAA